MEHSVVSCRHAFVECAAHRFARCRLWLRELTIGGCRVSAEPRYFGASGAEHTFIVERPATVIDLDESGACVRQVRVFAIWHWPSRRDARRCRRVDRNCGRRGWICHCRRGRCRCCDGCWLRLDRADAWSSRRQQVSARKPRASAVGRHQLDGQVSVGYHDQEAEARPEGTTAKPDHCGCGGRSSRRRDQLGCAAKHFGLRPERSTRWS